MDLNFLANRIETIGKYRCSKIELPHYKIYYEAYSLKLKGDLLYYMAQTNKNNISSALDFINRFEYKETNKMKTGTLFKPRKVINQVCKDVRDIVNSMKRWES